MWLVFRLVGMDDEQVLFLVRIPSSALPQALQVFVREISELELLVILEKGIHRVQQDKEF